MQIWQRFSETLAHWIVHRRWWVLGAVVVMLAAGVAVVASRQNFDSEVLNLLPGDTPAVDALKVVNSEFTQARELTFAIRGEPEAVAGFGKYFVEELKKEPWVVRVMAGSPMEEPDAIASLQPVVPALLLNLEGPAFQEALASLEPDALRARLQRLRAQMEAGSPKAEIELESDPTGLILGKALRPLASLSNGENRTGLESEDGTMRIIPVVTNQASLSQPDCAAMMDQVAAFKQRLTASYQGPKAEILVTGRTPFVAEIAASMQSDIQVTSTISILAVTALFYFGFRRLIPLIGIVFILAASCFASFALGSLFFAKLNLVAIAFCSILVGLGDDFSLLLYNRYLRARAQGEDHEKAIATSIGEVSKGIIYVALTTGAGFITLAASSSQGFSQLGILIAIGIITCGLFMIGLLFVFIPKNTTMGTKDRSRAILGPIVAKTKELRRPFGLTALVVFALVVGYALMPFNELKFDTNPRSLEPRTMPASIALRAIGEKFPSAKDPLFVLVQAKDAEDSHRRWANLNKRLPEMLDQGLLKSFASPAGMQFSPERVRAHQPAFAAVNWQEKRDTFLKVAAELDFNPEGLQSAAKLFAELDRAAKAKPEELIDLHRVLPDSSSWWFPINFVVAQNTLITRAHINPAQPLKESSEIERFERPVREADAAAQVTGFGYAMLALVPWARKEVVLFSAGITGLICVMLALAYRNWRPWLTHILSLVFAIGLTVTVLKLTGVQINLLNALAFPLILGVGVDYGMHILMAAHDTDELATVLKPVVISGMTTIVGFGALMAAKNPALSGLGVVCSIGVASCLVSALLFAVPVLGLFPQPRDKHE